MFGVLKYKGRLIERVKIKLASECEECPDCGEPWCTDCNEHYADCKCLGPANAIEEGFRLVERKKTQWNKESVLCGERTIRRASSRLKWRPADSTPPRSSEAPPEPGCARSSQT